MTEQTFLQAALKTLEEALAVHIPHISTHMNKGILGVWSQYMQRCQLREIWNDRNCVCVCNLIFKLIFKIK